MNEEKKYRRYEFLFEGGEKLADQLKKNDIAAIKKLRFICIVGTAFVIICAVKSYADIPKLLFIIILSAIFILKNRNEKLRIMCKKKKKEFDDTLPLICLQLILLLNSGFVIETALRELNIINSGKNSIMYEILRNTQVKASARNTSFSSELYSLSVQSADRNFIRFAGLIEDCKNKGAELSSKLEQEQSVLLSERLNRARALAKESETKLCFPLFLLLLVIIIISALPAFINL